MNNATIAVLLCISALAGPLAALAQAPAPSAGAPVLVVSLQAETAIENAGGRVVGPTVAPLAALGVGDADFLRQLSRSTWIFARDGVWIAEICGVKV